MLHQMNSSLIIESIKAISCFNQIKHISNKRSISKQKIVWKRKQLFQKYYENLKEKKFNQIENLIKWKEIYINGHGCENEWKTTQFSNFYFTLAPKRWLDILWVNKLVKEYIFMFDKIIHFKWITIKQTTQTQWKLNIDKCYQFKRMNSW